MTLSMQSEISFASIMAITNFGNCGNGVRAVPLLNRDPGQQPGRPIVLLPKPVSTVCPVSRLIMRFYSDGHKRQYAKPQTTSLVVTDFPAIDKAGDGVTAVTPHFQAWYFPSMKSDLR